MKTIGIDLDGDKAHLTILQKKTIIDLQTIDLKKKVRDLEDDLRYLFTHLPKGTFTEDKELVYKNSR